jgi:alpha-L-fucosidase
MSWKNPIMNARMTEDVRSEVTPFVFRGCLYRLENMMRFGDFEGKEPQYRYHEDGFRIRDVASDRIISIPLLNHYFAIAYVWEDRVYVVAGDYEDRPWWHIRHTIMICSDDLITWTKPAVIMEAAGQEHLFNYALCRARGKFYLLYETNDSRWPAFTMRFCESDDLVTWRRLPESYIYGADKYTGGPALYYDQEEDWFYILYVNAVPGPCAYYDNRIARSKDLILWEEALADRPIVSPDPQRNINDKKWPGARECSASDLEMCEFNGQTYLYWINGNQQGASAGWEAVYDGPMFQFLRKYFE